MTLTNGLLTINAKGLLPQSAPKVNIAATTLGAGGYKTLVDVNAGALDASGPGAAFTKQGAATLDVTAAHADGVDDLAGAAMRVEEGVMRVLKPSAVGQAELQVGSLGTYNTGIPQLLLSRDAGGGVYNTNVVFDGGDNTYRAVTEKFFNGNDNDAAIDPIQTGLMATPRLSIPACSSARSSIPIPMRPQPTSSPTPAALVNGTNVSGLWVGQLAIGGDSPSTGYVGFATRSDDGSTIWVDLNDNGTFETGEMIVDNKGGHGEQNRFGSVNLTPGQDYMFAIGWYDSGGDDYMAARFTTNSALALNDANYASMALINPIDTANGQDKLFLGNVFAREDRTLLTIGDMAGSTAGPVTLSGGMTVESGRATVDIKPGYSLSVPGGLTTSGVGSLTIQGGAMTIAATPLVDLEELRIISGASLAGLQSLTVTSALQMQGVERLADVRRSQRPDLRRGRHRRHRRRGPHQRHRSVRGEHGRAQRQPVQRRRPQPHLDRRFVRDGRLVHHELRQRERRLLPDVARRGRLDDLRRAEDPDHQRQHDGQRHRRGDPDQR